MTEVEFRRFQEAMANMVRMKDEVAESLFELYKAYQKAGFTKNESMTLIKALMIGK
ncbi:MAG: hypothetical protein ACFFAU_01110 [Candidatus Hodarchaeota archaeon]